MRTAVQLECVEGIITAIGNNPEWGFTAEHLREVIEAEAQKVGLFAGDERVFVLRFGSKSRPGHCQKFYTRRGHTGAIYVGACDSETWRRVRA